MISMFVGHVGALVNPTATAKLSTQQTMPDRKLSIRQFFFSRSGEVSIVKKNA